MDLQIVIGQGIGIIALTLAVISFQQKTHTYILWFQLLANFFFVVHFGLIGAVTGAILNVVALLRSIVFINKGKKWADNIFWLFFFCAASILAGIFTCDFASDGIKPILPIAGMICSTVAFWIKSPKVVRIVAFPSSPLWLVYNALNLSVAGVATEIVNMTSIVIAMIRLDFRKAKNE